MWKMIIRRILILIPQLIAISLLVFILATFMPGDALSGMIDPTLSMEQIERQREILGLDEPLPARYISWISGIIFEGDFGNSFTHRRPVMEVIGERAGNTIRLSIGVILLTYIIAIPLGVISGRFNGKSVDKIVLVYVFVALSMPALILGILMIWLFAFNLGLFPSGGSVDAITLAGGNALEILANRIHHAVLPVVTGALVSTVGIIFMLRANIIERTHSDYVMMAKSKGLPTGLIFRRHILRNSLIPVAAGIGLFIAGMLMGVVFIEMIFSYPGIGRLFFDSITARDFAVVNALVMIFAALTALGTLISDIVLVIVDPRIRIE